MSTAEKLTVTVSLWPAAMLPESGEAEYHVGSGLPVEGRTMLPERVWGSEFQPSPLRVQGRVRLPLKLEPMVTLTVAEADSPPWITPQPLEVSPCQVIVTPLPLVTLGVMSPPLPPTKLVALFTVTPAGKLTITSSIHSVSELLLVTVKVQFRVVPGV